MNKLLKYALIIFGILIASFVLLIGIVYVYNGGRLITGYNLGLLSEADLKVMDIHSPVFKYETHVFNGDDILFTNYRDENTVIIMLGVTGDCIPTFTIDNIDDAQDFRIIGDPINPYYGATKKHVYYLDHNTCESKGNYYIIQGADPATFTIPK